MRDKSIHESQSITDRGCVSGPQAQVLGFICEDIVLYAHQNYLKSRSDRLRNAEGTVSWNQCCLKLPFCSEMRIKNLFITHKESFYPQPHVFNPDCVSLHLVRRHPTWQKHTEMPKRVMSPNFTKQSILLQFLEVYACYMCHCQTNVGINVDLSEQVTF